MSAILANWKTSSAGLFLIVAAGLEIAGVSIPGLSGDPTALLVSGFGLIVAGDAKKG